MRGHLHCRDTLAEDRYYCININSAGLKEVGGFHELYVKYLEATPNTTSYTVNTSCGEPREDAWMMLRDPRSSDLPWPGFLLGQTPASIWYWCTDQVTVGLHDITY